jgi:hypothetical protein
MSGKTDALRLLRDNRLLKSEPGKAFVRAYYEYSPPVAAYIAERGWLRGLVRVLLLPVIGLAWLLA